MRRRGSFPRTPETPGPCSCRRPLRCARTAGFACSGRRRPRARQELAPVLLDDLRAARGPPVALFLERLERIGQQAPAVAAVGVERAPAVLEDGKPEVGILDDGVARPAARRLDRGAAEEAHG